ncbi:cystathionine gamma-synthase-like protein [Lasiosphaeria miniovina]|uniref:cystathionine gamma-synthase n=1 Tax=Lasiosphaeria miniovina TaxID=1954250 RepID=A0AA40ADH0_9PEZI|nr:cystathionine gamma-synthase-like protein [Lasiosphaeria miniovina]KAK0713858.1 cystathionine gamma-synthase-like protein [Lasiosphaeria miniovina]
MTTGYPRFFIHRSIEAFANDIVAMFGSPGLHAMLFPTRQIAKRCVAFVKSRGPPGVARNPEIIHLVLDVANPASAALEPLGPSIAAVMCSQEAFPFAKQYWQHSGDGVSSRRAEFCHGLFKDGLLCFDDGPKSPSAAAQKPCRGPKRYRRMSSIDAGKTPISSDASPTSPAKEPGVIREAQESSRFLEERFGRNLDIAFVEPAKSAIRRRIAGAVTSDHELSTSPIPEMNANSRGIVNLKEDDVYLFPCGMNAIFNAHRALLDIRGSMKSIDFGFPYVDTLKILEKFGPGCVFYGHASESDLDDLEARLEGGERFLGLFCEFPGNPLLTCPDLVRIRQLADKYDFAVVVDETIGTFGNINVLQFSDVVVSSLTKIFSGDCNVMGGSAIFNPDSRYYSALKTYAQTEFEYTYWPEDLIFMERNSRDFASRIDRINTNAEAICDVLRSHPLVKMLYYPKYGNWRSNYEICKLPDGGYGGLLSVVFHRQSQAVAFFDTIDTAKGPSLGTNFTLTSPYVLLAHYQELDWAASFGVDPHLIRISVGLEETEHIVNIFKSALSAAEKALFE